MQVPPVVLHELETRANVPLKLPHVEFGIDGIKVFAVQLILYEPEPLAETLIMYDFTLAEESYRVYDIRVVSQPENVVVGNASLLLCCNHIRTTFN